MHNPLRSEADVFRLVIVIGIGAAAVVALTLLTRPVVGLILAAALIGFGVGLAYRGARGSLPSEFSPTSNDDSKHRLLVVANETVAGQALLDEIARRCKGRDCEVFVVAPALAGSRAAHWASDIDDGIELARQRLQVSLERIERLGLSADGEIGDSDPNLAIEDALRQFAADEVVISTHPPERSRWLEHGVVSGAREKLSLPVTHVVVDLEAEGADGAQSYPARSAQRIGSTGASR
jgi:GABA permease